MTSPSTKFIAAISACLVASFAGATTESPARAWEFDVALDGKPIGSHTFELQHDGAQQVLTTEARFDVKFLFVTAFRYRHENTEVWNDGCLSSIDASTNSNGDLLAVNGTLGDGQFDVTSTQGMSSLPACVQTFAYWNPRILEAQQLLNSQTGEYENVKAVYEGPDQIKVAGSTVEAFRYRLSASAGDIVLWYSTDETTWLGLEAPANGGRKLTYTAVAVPKSDWSQSLAQNSMPATRSAE
ncbi:MAG: DUF6134 family protein [Woeseiaceae bacterium]|nr:DUF6134 family protein [Woeseiaceae bacterium]